MSLKVGELYAILGLDDKPFQQGLAGMGGALADITKVGAAAAVGIGVAFAGAAVVGVKEFAKFQQGMNEVFTLLPGISQQSMDQMSEQVKSLATDFGIMPEKVIPALYQAISAGVPPDNVFEFLRTSAKASIGGVATLEESVNAITGVMNNYAKGAYTAEEASDLLFTTVRLGKTTFSELSKYLPQVLPAAAAAKIGFDEVSAAMATMASKTGQTAESSTKLRQMFIELADNTTGVGKTFEKLSGKTFTDFKASGGTVQQALEMLGTYAAESGLTMQQLFSSVEAGGAALLLTGDNAGTFTNNLNEMTKAAGATDQAFDLMKDGVLQKWNRLKADLEVIAINIGAVLLPPIQEAAEKVLAAFDTIKKWWDDHEFEIESKIQQLIDKLKDLGDHSKEGWDKLGGEEQKPEGADQIGGAPEGPGSSNMSGGELTAGMFSMGAEQGAEAGGKLARVWTQVIIPAAGALGAALLFLASGAFMILGTVLNATIDILYGIGVAIGVAINALIAAAGWIAAIPGKISAAWEWWEANRDRIYASIWETIAGAFWAAVGAVGDALGVLWAIVQADFALIYGIASSVFWGILDAASSAISGIIGAVSGAIGSVVGLFSGLPGQILGALGDLSRLLYDAGVSIIQGLYDGISDKVGDVYDFVSGIGDQIKGLKGPIEKDRILLVPEANAIMDGLINTIVGRASDLTSTMRNITGLIQVGGSAGTPTLAAVGSANQPVSVTIHVPEYMDPIKHLVRVEVNGIAQQAKVSSNSRVKGR